MTDIESRQDGEKLDILRQPGDGAALPRILRNISELGLDNNLSELEALGYTTIKGVLNERQIESAQQAVLARIEKTTGKRIDLDTATKEEFQDLTYVPYMLYDDEVFEEILMEPKPLAMITYLLDTLV